MRDKLGGSAGKRPVQDRDLQLGAEGLTQRDPLVERRDEKQPAAGGRQRPRDRRRAQPIPVRLDHGGAGGRSGPSRKKSPIRGNGAEVDVENRARPRPRVTTRGHNSSPQITAATPPSLNIPRRADARGR